MISDIIIARELSKKYFTEVHKKCFTEAHIFFFRITYWIEVIKELL